MAMTVMISKNAIDNYLWRVEYYLMRNHGVQMAQYYMYALNWYVKSGRASSLFLRTMVRSKPEIIGRILVKKDGAIDDTIRELKRYLNCENAS